MVLFYLLGIYWRLGRYGPGTKMMKRLILARLCLVRNSSAGVDLASCFVVKISPALHCATVESTIGINASKFQKRSVNNIPRGCHLRRPRCWSQMLDGFLLLVHQWLPMQAHKSKLTSQSDLQATNMCRSKLTLRKNEQGTDKPVRHTSYANQYG